MRLQFATASLLSLAACSSEGTADPPTWSSHIGALVYENCTVCHRPGESAPFDLLTYDDARRKHRQIARVTTRRLMPPWLPTHGDFVGDRRLTADEIAQIAAWSLADAPLGDADAAPGPPEFAAGWHRGEPDLVVTADRPLRVPKDGPDLFRNLVLPVAQSSMRYVAAVEIRPGSKAVHHAILQLDGTQDSRRRDAQDEAPGFPGMSMGLSRAPDGHFVGWTPGKVPHENPPGFAWRLWPGNDLVLQLHLTPTGKEELVQPRIGFWFTDEPMVVQPFALVMRSEEIDIAAGDADFVARDHILLPTAVAVHAVYPHAHYLCTTMRAWATLPDGSETTLFATDHWDFDWQDDYRYKTQPMLPAGTRVDFEYHYDNSASNPNNPATPPRRVQYGLESNDEMATLTLTLVAVDPTQRPQLLLAAALRDVERAPLVLPHLIRLSIAFREAGDLESAATVAEKTIEASPDYAPAHRELGICRAMAGRFADAESALLEALRLDPDDSIARMQYGELLGRAGKTKQAIAQFDQVLALHPNNAILQNNLATALFIDDQLERAAFHYAAATRIDPGYFNAWFNRGRVLTALGRKEAATDALEHARLLRPNHPGLTEAFSQLRSR